MALLPRKRAFALEYVRNGLKDAAAAAKAAGYSEATAASQGSRLLQDADVEAFIEQTLEDLAADVACDAKRILNELARIAFADIGEAFDEQGNLRPLKDIPKHVRQAIAAVETDELFAGRGEDREQTGFVRKVKFWPKDKALELLGKNLKLFTDKFEVSGKLTLEQLVTGSMDPTEPGK